MLFKMYHKSKLKFCCQTCDVIFPPKTIKTENKRHTIVLNTNFFHLAQFRTQGFATFPVLIFSFLFFSCNILFRNPYLSETESIAVPLPKSENGKVWISALEASGFTRTPEQNDDFWFFLPCPVGTFSNSSSQGSEGCISCPPGIVQFYIVIVLPCLSVFIWIRTLLMAKKRTFSNDIVSVY